MAKKPAPPPTDDVLEHLDELRGRLVHSLASLVVGFALCWSFADRIFHFTPSR